MFFKNRNICSKIKRSKVTDYAALNLLSFLQRYCPCSFSSGIVLVFQKVPFSKRVLKLGVSKNIGIIQKLYSKELRLITRPGSRTTIPLIFFFLELLAFLAV